MAYDSRGQVVYNVASNRAPFYIDGTYTPDSGAALLAAAGTKTINIKQVVNNALVSVEDKGVNEASGLPALGGKRIPSITQQVTIINSSGQPAQVTFVVARDQQAQLLESMVNPINILSGEMITVPVRAVQIIEKNTGGSTQTGNGVRYICTLEPHS